MYCFRNTMNPANGIMDIWRDLPKFTGFRVGSTVGFVFF